MRTILAFFVGATLVAGGAFAECDQFRGPVGPNGRPVSSAAPVSGDGYYMQNGKVMMLRNGGISELTQETTLDDGSRIQADGTVILRDGTRRRLENNQWVFLDGRFSDIQGRVAETREGYYRENGKTLLFRNGTRSEVTSEVTLANGDKLQPNGTLIKKDGSRTELREGQNMAFDGSIREQGRPSEPAPQNASRDRFNEGSNPNTNNREPRDVNNGQPQNAQPGEPHRDRGATQSTKDTNPPDSKNGQADEGHRDRNATQSSDKPTENKDQPTQGRNDNNKRTDENETK